ncbi:hypothetical protein J1N35_011988, partial [Gossypium stocksii]
ILFNKIKRRVKSVLLSFLKETVHTVVGKKMSGDLGKKADRNEIALLEEELIQLTVKSSLVIPSENPTLIYSLWTRKSYNPDSLRVQLKSIWKTKKKFEICIAGQNLFTISFDEEEDLEQILEGRPGLFRKQLIVFERLTQPMERNKIQLTVSPFWLKARPCPPECDKKDLMHAIGSTFGGVIRGEIKGKFCLIRVNLNIQKQLKRGIFISPNGQGRVWLPFKYENLPTFCFGCGRMGHGVKDCLEKVSRECCKIEDEYPFVLALKAESSAVGKESFIFNSQTKKSMQ